MSARFGWAALGVVLLLAPLLFGCPPASSAPPVTDAGVCGSLARNACAEGADPACANRVILALTSEHRLTEAQARCAATAQGKPAVRACAPEYFTCP